MSPLVGVRVRTCLRLGKPTNMTKLTTAIKTNTTSTTGHISTLPDLTRSVRLVVFVENPVLAMIDRSYVPGSVS